VSDGRIERVTRVLIVDDSPDVQAGLEGICFTLDGVEIAASTRGEMETTSWVLNNPDAWDIGVVDLALREGSGLNLVPRLRRENPVAVIIVFSEFATNEVSHRCKELGADAVFLKSDLHAFSSYLEARAREMRLSRS
jgi:two-component system, OmpR family, response regulator